MMLVAHRFIFGFSLALFTSVTPAWGATPASWNGGSGSWSDPTGWSTNPFYPTNGNGATNYTATIGGGSVGLDVNVNLDSLTINGGSLSGSGSLTVDTINLNNGTWSTTGTVLTNHVNLSGGVLDRDLTLSTGTSSIQNVNVSAGHTLTNGVNSILTAPAGPGERQAFGLGTFNNEGTFIKNGTARTYMSVTHSNNLGDVQVQQSQLRFDQTGQHTGTFEISSGAQLEFAGTQSLSSTATISGEGTLAILGGTSTIDSNVTVGSLRLVSGTLSGSGNLTPTSFSLEGGILDRDLTLSTGTSSIQNVNVSAGHTLTNGVNSILTAPAGPGERQAFGLGTFNNEGTFIKTGTARTYMSVTHSNNLGDVQVQQSSLRFDQTGQHTGTFEISSGAQLEFAGTQSLSSTAIISGEGTLAILGGTSTIDSNVSVGVLRLVSGTLSGSGSFSASSYSLEGGVLNRDLTLVSGTSSIQNVNVSAGHTLTNGVNSILTAPAGPGERQAFGLGTFNNEGTFIKSGTARSYMSITHANNLGDVQVQQSQLRFDQIGQHTGTFEVSAGAQIEFGGTQRLASTATISGPGTMVIVGGHVTVNSEVTLSSLRVTGGMMDGDGLINAPTSVESLLSGISAGDGVGTLTFNSGLSLQSGTILFWDLAALDTTQPGVNWDQIVINGGQLNLGTFNFMKVNLPGEEYNPISGNPFWATTHRWEDIVSLTSGSSGIVGTPNFTVDNTQWSRAGAFTVELSSDGRGLDVVWTAIPEPSTVVLTGMVVFGSILIIASSRNRGTSASA